jgi:hypothetical protein
MGDISGFQAPWQAPTQSAGATDVVTQLQGIVRQLTALVQAISGRMVFGTFTMPVANTLTIVQPGIKSNSVVSITPTNASAATLMGSAKALFPTIIAGTSFTVTTASGGNAAGTETFSYTINTPT